MKKSRFLIILALLATIALLISNEWRNLSGEPRYRLFVNFDSVSVTPDWPWLTGLYYMLCDDWTAGRFGHALVSNANEFDNRFPEVPAGHCCIEFTDMGYFSDQNEQHIWTEANLTLHLPRERDASSLVLQLIHCPGLKGIAVDSQQNPAVQDGFLSSCESPEMTVNKHRLFYLPASSAQLKLPFSTGKADIYLIYAPTAENRQGVVSRIGITRL